VRRAGSCITDGSEQNGGVLRQHWQHGRRAPAAKAQNELEAEPQQEKQVWINQVATQRPADNVHSARQRHCRLMVRFVCPEGTWPGGEPRLLGQVVQPGVHHVLRAVPGDRGGLVERADAAHAARQGRAGRTGWVVGRGRQAAACTIMQ